MPLRTLGLALIVAVLTGATAVAQTQTAPAAPPHHSRQRITINPRPLLYRHCVDWYELQHRPSGTVLYPQMRCWWVRA